MEVFDNLDFRVKSYLSKLESLDLRVKLVDLTQEELEGRSLFCQKLWELIWYCDSHMFQRSRVLWLKK